MRGGPISQLKQSIDQKQEGSRQEDNLDYFVTSTGKRWHFSWDSNGVAKKRFTEAI